MDQYIEKWFQIIQNMNNSNTYKTAWGRAILDCVTNDKIAVSDKTVYISFEDIANNMLRYYWNQTFYFELNQGPRNKLPVFQKLVQELIEKYKDDMKSNFPTWYDSIETKLFQDGSYNNYIRKAITILNENVSYRFLNVSGKQLEIYKLLPIDETRKTMISLTLEDYKVLKKWSLLLVQLLNYKWVQLLETYNHSPNIAGKIRGSQENKLKRNNLTRYKKILLKQFKSSDAIDFYTGKVLKDNDISVDHVIPWSFLYSDDLWNLVLTSKSINSKKSNNIVDKTAIEALNLRNEHLLQVLDETDKEYDQLKLAIDKNYLNKFYNDLLFR